MSTRSVEGVVLAAGLSSRAGGFKMELPLDGKPLVVRAVESMGDSVRRVFVVVGWQAERVCRLLAENPRVEIVLNPRYEEGMFSSVKAGLARVSAEACFLLPGDHPCAAPEVFRRLLAATGDIVVPAYGGRRGHPILLSSRVILEILAWPDGGTLRDFVREKGSTIVPVEDEGILLDMDTMSDYRALVARVEGRKEGLP